MFDSDKYNKVSVRSLPVKDISELLRYQYGFASLRTLDVNAMSDLAVVGSKEIGRSNVAFAMNLYDEDSKESIPAKDVLTKKDKGYIENYAEEIKDLREELYQLKGEMSRKGYSINQESYSGFVEGFNGADKLYDDKKIGLIDPAISTGNKLYFKNNSFLKDLMVDDFIVFHSAASGINPSISTVEAIDTNNNMIETFIPFPITEDVYVTKHLGRYYQGGYAFIKELGDGVGQRNETSFDDDSETTERTIIREESGYGYTFKVNERRFEGGEPTKGYFADFSILAERVGNPGPLRAYLMKESDLSQFIGIKDPKFLQELCVGISRDTNLDLPEYKEQKNKMTFSFQKENGLFPIVESTRYFVLIKAAGFIDESNHYRIEFLKGNGTDGDLQVNNKTYEFDGRIEGAKSLNGEGSHLKADLHYAFGILPILKEEIQPYEEGLYTKKFKVRRGEGANRVRVSMRINREGLFDVKENSSNGLVRYGVDVKNNPERIYEGLSIKESGIGAVAKDIVIVNDQFSEFLEGSMTASSVSTRKPIIANIGDDVYRMGYKLFVRMGKEIIVETATSKSSKEVMSIDRVPMKLIDVIPDRTKRGEHISDRLIFECDVPEGKEYNLFEFQAKWNAGNMAMALHKNDLHKKEMHGAIQDLTVSIERRTAL